MNGDTRRTLAILIPAIPERFAITTALAPDAVIECVSGLASLAPRRFLIFPPKRPKNIDYYGRADRDTFTIYPYLRVRDGGYLMKIYGEVERIADGSIVTVSFSARLWLIAFLFVCVMEVFAVQIKNENDLIWGLVGFWIFYHALGCYLYWLQESRARKNLISALERWVY
jgi:hypothetical protein